MITLLITKHFNGEAKERVKEIKKLHEQVQNKIVKQNKKYCGLVNEHQKSTYFKEGDLAWIHIRKERFPSKRSSKLMLRVDDPFRVLQLIGKNA